MKPIGGYFGLECGENPLYYEDGIYLNSCRNALRYLIRALGINKIFVPYYTCHVVYEAIKAEHCDIEFYHIDNELMPEVDFKTDSFILYNNYFGISGKRVKQLANIYPNLIVDNAQAFYSEIYGRAAIYSPRKFFGLPDGGILRGKDIPILNLKTSTSYDVCSHLLKRLDLGPQEGYEDFIENDKTLGNYEICLMSPVTSSLMKNVNYYEASQRRLQNFEFLLSNLPTSFPRKADEEDIPLIFPMLHKEGKRIRKELIDNKIFCANYWPSNKDKEFNEIESNLKENLVAIPCDQRYSIKEMKYILNVFKTITAF